MLDAELIVLALRRGGVPVEVEQVADSQAFHAALLRGGHDLILSDYQLPSFDGLEVLALARRHAPEVPFIFVSGVLGEERAVETLKQGAVDYVLKQRLARLPSAVRRALCEARERRDRREAEERGKLLVAELSHRVKNTLATVVSVARLTLKRAATLEEFEASFFGRLNALADANGLIFEANWGETDIRRVLERTLRPFGQGAASFRLEGDVLPLPPKPAVALSLVFHELATNAAKYGALSRDGGGVEVSWEIDGRRRVRLLWRERGGPAVAPPLRRGFGTTLIERSLRYELDGRAQISHPVEGVEARLDFSADWRRSAWTDASELADQAARTVFSAERSPSAV
jgi:two-component sensor histidine kinase